VVELVKQSIGLKGEETRTPTGSVNVVRRSSRLNNSSVFVEIDAGLEIQSRAFGEMGFVSESWSASE